MDDAENTYAPAAKFVNEGDMVVGTVLGFSTVHGDYGPQTVMTIEQEDGDEVAVYVSNLVLKNQLKAADPKVGEKVGVKYLGKLKSAQGREYKNWVVLMDRPEPAEGASFSSHTAKEDGVVSDHGPDEDQPAGLMTEDQLAAAGDKVAAGKRSTPGIEDGDDDLPF